MVKRDFPVLVATDGGPEANEAIAATLSFPWPTGAQASGVVARSLPVMAELTMQAVAAMDQGLEKVAADARRALGTRWPGANVAIVDKSAVEAILAQAQMVRARVIVVGCRGQGAIGRFILGSVSRGVMRRAGCAVLVVKAPLKTVRRIVLGVDGSDNARRATSFVGTLKPPAGGEVTLVQVAESVRLPSLGLVPAPVRKVLSGEMAALNARHVKAIRADLEQSAAALSRVGWKVKPVVRVGAPVPELLAAARTARADVVVLGARGISGLERLLLGSVAEGVLDQFLASVLVVR